MIIMKFGGSSLKTSSNILKTTKIIKFHKKKRPVIVVSACGDTTDYLIKLSYKAVKGTINIAPFRFYCNRLLKDLNLEVSIIDELLAELETLLKGIGYTRELTPKTSDYVLSFGERIASRIISARLNKEGFKSVPVDSFKIGMITDSTFGNATPLVKSYKLIKQHLSRNKNKLRIITGFIGKDKHGNITTLGRNGSDYSACVIASAINAKEVQIWTDTNGLMSANPKTVKGAQTLKSISFNEASELAYYSRRFHPSALIPAIRKNIPVRVLNTFNPKHKGTTILSKPKNIAKVKAVVYKPNLYMVGITSTRMLLYAGFLKEVFEIFGRHKIVIDMIATSEISISITTDSDKNLDKAIKELSGFAQVTCYNKKAIVCIIGEHLRRIPKLTGKVFTELEKNGIKPNMISQGARRINLALLVDNKTAPKAVQIIHKLFLGK